MATEVLARILRPQGASDKSQRFQINMCTNIDLCSSGVFSAVQAPNPRPQGPRIHHIRAVSRSHVYSSIDLCSSGASAAQAQDLRQQGPPPATGF